MSNRSSVPPKRLPTFAGLRLVNDAGYCELIAQLTDSRERLEAGHSALAEAGYCVRAVLSFINQDAVAKNAVSPGPLSKLHAALHDLEQGASPALFAKVSPQGGKPTNIMSRDIVKAWVAAAYNKLVQATGEREKTAAWIAQECVSLGIWHTKVKIDAKHVVRWHKDFEYQQIAAADAVNLYKSLKDKKHVILNPWENARLTLETYVQVMMEPKNPDTPTLPVRGGPASC